MMHQQKQYHLNINCQEEQGSAIHEDCNWLFYLQYKKLYNTTLILSKKMNSLLQRKSQAWLKLAEYEKRAEQFKDNIRGQPPQKKKRSRRTADQIQRQYICEVERCHKCYGTQGSLYQHIKLKHPTIYTEIKHKNGGLSHSLSEDIDSSNQQVEQNKREQSQKKIKDAVQN